MQSMLQILTSLLFVAVIVLPSHSQTTTVQVYLNGVQIDPLYDDDNDPSNDPVLNLTVVPQYCDDVQVENDVKLSFCINSVINLDFIDPQRYQTHPLGKVSFVEWRKAGVYATNSLNYAYTIDGNKTVSAHFTETISGLRDPVSIRWNPDAGRRGGGDLAWGPSYLTAKSQVSDVTSEAFPALLYSGEAYEKQVDLAVKGRGMDFVFSRVHRSGAPDGNLDGDEEETIDNFGLGGQWTHSFDITLKSPDLSSFTTPANVRLGNGTVANFYQKFVVTGTPSYRYFYTEGWDAELELEHINPNYVYTLKFGDGVVWRFESFTGTSLRTLRLQSIADRFGNTITLAYDVNNRLESITDTLSREYTIAYVSGEDLIESLTEEDGLGRVISYGYNVDDELTTVSYPATSALPNPNEPTITYAYDGDGRLTMVTDPRGNEILGNVYTGGALTSQQHGDGTEAAMVSYVYTGLTLGTGENHGVRVTDGAGHVTEHYFNAMNQLVRMVRLDAHAQILASNSIIWSVHTFISPLPGTIDFTVSEDLPASIVLPDGIVVEFLYQGPGAQPTGESTIQHPDYKYRMNPVSITRTGPGGKKLIEEFGHDDLGGSVPYWDARFGESFVTCHTLRDGAGALLGATAYTYSSDDLATLDGIDYYGIAPYAGDPFAVCPPSGLGSFSLLSTMETSALESLLESEVMYSSLFQQFETSSSLYEFESILFGGEPESMPMSMASEAHHDEFYYNEFGQLIEHRHPDNDEDGDPGDKVRRKDVFVYDDDADGYLDRKIVDADNEALTTAFTQDAVGRVTHVFDPMNNETIIDYDQLDQVLQVRQPLIDTATDYRPTTDYAYDENGNLVLSRHQWKDAAGAVIEVAGETQADFALATEYAYDTRNRLLSVGREDGSSATPGAGLTVSETEYDGNGNVVKQLSPLAVEGDEPDNVTSYEYDTRNLPVRVVRGNEIVTRIDYDAGGRVVRTIEGYGTAEARLMETAYDGLGYLKSTRNAAGLTTEYETDALGRVIDVRAKEGANILSRTQFAYDQIGRLTNVSRRHLNASGVPVGDGWLRTVRAYTDAGKVLSETVEGDTMSYLYDTVMRTEQVVSPGGNSRVHAYDDNGNLLTTMEHAFDTESETTTSFVTRYGYDELDRMVSLSLENSDASVSNATAYAYDSLGQLTSETDARGNVTTHAHDPLGRLTSTTRDPGGIAAAVSYAYDGNGRLVLASDPNGNETAHAYDHLNRLVETVYADGQVERYAYDALGIVVEHIAPGGLLTQTTRDAAGRPVAQRFSRLSGRADPGETRWTYDALGRVREAKNAVSTVTHAYDSLGNPGIERLRYNGKLLPPLTRAYDEKGLIESVDPPGAANTLTYARNADGLATGVARASAQLASLTYLGARPAARVLMNGNVEVASTAIGYEATGLRPVFIDHLDNANAMLDSRVFGWDAAYNLDDFEITGGALDTDTLVDLDYDALNRIVPASIGADWMLDGAGNRTNDGYSFEGDDEMMHRYTEAAGLGRFYDPQGALMAASVDTDSMKLYNYDASDRLDFYRTVTVAENTEFNDLNLSDGDWPVIIGNWSVNTSGSEGDYLEETTSATGAILYAPSPLPGAGFTFRYRLAGPGPGAGDYPAEYYAQALLYVDTSLAPLYPYAALRIEPDRLSFVVYDGADIHEVDSAVVASAADTWYTIKLWHVAGGPDGGTLSVLRIGGTPGDPVAMLLNAPISDAPPASAIGFTVGEKGNYHFQLVEYADAPEASEVFIDRDHDAYGRKIAETVYNSANAVTSKTVYVYDGWRLVAELDARKDYRVVAEYVPGPAYVDDTVAFRRDHNRDGDFADAGEGFLYCLADQQHSTVALLDANGDVVERYGYDAFGAPTFHDGEGVEQVGVDESAYGNTRLYTGREWLPALGHYDYRQRVYDPANGRFLTTDPIGAYGDPNNLGNPYTYVANNPYSFVDPMGDMGNPFEWFASLWLEERPTSALNPQALRRYNKPVQLDPGEATEEFLERSAHGDNTRGIDAYRIAARKGVNAGRKAVEWGAAGAQMAPAVGLIISGAIAIEDASAGDWFGAALGGAGMVGGIRVMSSADDMVRPLEHVVNYRNFTRANFRENLARHTGVRPPNAEAHHIFPIRFTEKFEQAGINVHNPSFGAWVESGMHRQKAHLYNKRWEEFLESNPDHQEIIDFARKLAPEFNFTAEF